MESKSGIGKLIGESNENIAIELAIYADALIEGLIDNDWYEGDYEGEDSMAYYDAEDNVRKVIAMILKYDPTLETVETFATQDKLDFEQIRNGREDFLTKYRPKWLKPRVKCGGFDWTFQRFIKMLDDATEATKGSTMMFN